MKENILIQWLEKKNEHDKLSQIKLWDLKVEDEKPPRHSE